MISPEQSVADIWNQGLSPCLCTFDVEIYSRRAAVDSHAIEKALKLSPRVSQHRDAMSEVFEEFLGGLDDRLQDPRAHFDIGSAFEGMLIEQIHFSFRAPLGFTRST